MNPSEYDSLIGRRTRDEFGENGGLYDVEALEETKRQKMLLHESYNTANTAAIAAKFGLDISPQPTDMIKFNDPAQLAASNNFENGSDTEDEDDEQAPIPFNHQQLNNYHQMNFAQQPIVQNINAGFAPMPLPTEILPSGRKSRRKASTERVSRSRWTEEMVCVCLCL